MPESSRNPHPGMSSPLAALCFAVLLGGCGVGAIFTEIDPPESPGVETAPWPELADTPQPDALRASAPDPAEGGRIIAALGTESAVATAEAERLAAPVFDVEALRADAAELRAPR